jgi:hypothetical protein
LSVVVATCRRARVDSPGNFFVPLLRARRVTNGVLPSKILGKKFKNISKKFGKNLAKISKKHDKQKGLTTLEVRRAMKNGRHTANH